MNTTTRSIRAMVSPRLIETARFFFDQGARTVIHELLQNARRAGATGVSVDLCSNGDNATKVTMRDNGRGIDDPQLLLTLGDTGWDQDIRSAEMPAGFGFFSLAAAAGRIVVRSHNWMVEMTPDAFNGSTDLDVIPADHIDGTEITFTLDEPYNTVHTHFSTSLCYFPVPATINGEVATQNDFLDGAIYVDDLDGVRIGVFDGQCTGKDAINFHGRTLACDAFGGYHCQLVRGSSLYVCVDVSNNSALDLVLPARDSVVRNEKLDRLVVHARRAIYRAIKSRNIPHSISYKCYLEARSMGVDLPEAEPQLAFARQRPVQDSSCDNRSPFDSPWQVEMDNCGRPKPVRVNGCHAIIDDDCAGIAAYHLAAQFADTHLPLPLRHDRDMAGYSWYPSTRIDSLVFEATAADGQIFTWAPDEPIPDAIDPMKNRPQSLRVVITVAAPGIITTSRVPVPFAFGNSDQVPIDAVFSDWSVTTETNQDNLGFDIFDALEFLFFYTSDGIDSDSWESQHDDFIKEAEEAVCAVFRGQEAAAKESILQAINEWKPRSGSRTLRLKSLCLTFDEDGYASIESFDTRPDKEPADN